MLDSQKTLLIACGALACEMETLKKHNRMESWEIRFLPARWHNHPQKIPHGLETILKEEQGKYSNIWIVTTYYKSFWFKSSIKRISKN